MKTIVIAVSVLAVGSLSALAGSCGSGCGGKDKSKGGKEKEAPKESAISWVIQA